MRSRWDRGASATPEGEKTSLTLAALSRGARPDRVRPLRITGPLDFGTGSFDDRWILFLLGSGRLSSP